MRCRGVLVGLLVGAATLLAAPAAEATFHEMWIREVYAGSTLRPSSAYVELQMWSSGQNSVGGHVLTTYGPGGGASTSTNEFTQKVPNGANQSTILLATPEAESEFGLVADTGLASDKLDPDGGAVCWEDLDCVSWGSFSGALPSPAGPPAPVIPSGMALRRTIAPLCPTALDGGDDRNDSAADFSVVFPAPRPNSVAPSEQRCAAGGGEGGSGGQGTGGGGKKGAPQTTLRRKPGRKTRDRTPTFRFTSDEPGSTFQCKLDGKPFRGCRSPFTTKRLALGPHTFRVRARDESGQRDPSPASYGFKVLPKS
jgi:hypothetical protein